MEDIVHLFDHSSNATLELWRIVTYIYGNYDFAIEALSKDTLDEAYEARWDCEADTFPWKDDDMIECAERWCSTVVVKNTDHKALPDYTDDYEQRHQKEEQIRLKSTAIWDSFKHEFRLLFCTNDKKYSTIRRRIATLAGQKSQFAIMSAVASALAVNVGAVTATILTPLCAICVLAGINIWREVLCSRLSAPGFNTIGVEIGTGASMGGVRAKDLRDMTIQEVDKCLSGRPGQFQRCDADGTPNPYGTHLKLLERSASGTASRKRRGSPAPRGA
jgi:hypothetical protein